MKAVFDTNILIDYLNGVDAARLEIKRVEQACISPITWMEVMVGAGPDTEAPVRAFLEGFTQLPITARVAEQAVELRRQRRLRLPDAIIWASARVEGLVFITRNTKDFPDDAEGIRVPYSG